MGPRVRLSERAGFRCPFCHTRENPLIKARTTLGGWVAFGAFLIVGAIGTITQHFFLSVFFLLAPAMLFLRGPSHVCSECSMRLD